MAALIAYVVLFFAPVVGIEPPVLDDAASGRFLYPKIIPLTAFVVGGAVEILVLRTVLIRGSRCPWRSLAGALATSYGASAAVAVLTSLVLRSSILNTVSVQGVFTSVAIGLALVAYSLAGLSLSILRRPFGLSGVSQWRLLRVSAAENLISLAAASITWAGLLLVRHRWHG